MSSSAGTLSSGGYNFLRDASDYERGAGPRENALREVSIHTVAFRVVYCAGGF